MVAAALEREISHPKPSHITNVPVEQEEDHGENAGDEGRYQPSNGNWKNT